MKSAINKVTGLTAGFTTEWVVKDDGEWRPLTALELSAVEAEYSTIIQEELRLQAKADRDTALSTMQHTLLDGSIVQVTPSDLTNFQISIDMGVAKDWVLKNNTVRALTVAEMQECLSSGVTQANAIWKTYTDFLKLNQ